MPATETSLEVILYRLDHIDGRLDQLVSRESHSHLSGRMQAVEQRLAEQNKERRQLLYAVLVALVAPVVMLGALLLGVPAVGGS